ncbi:hypothetical protein [Actinomycetospora sp. TBRC 11914]|uniref:hypothetical protein n=1 Tax=Actinomycetospora sp. TBRC 11914 TaxID=2729387 RepID=UPI00145E950A|nr:hypothetical protein [Actinomycetospora sp. TBRC 11914]NMO93580.1 hypothetical protein [Actinomycetospora sp. TBRC 11914]
MIDAGSSPAEPGSALGAAVRRLLLLVGLLAGMLLLGAVFAAQAHADTGGGRPSGGSTPGAHAPAHQATKPAARSVGTGASVSVRRATHTDEPRSTTRPSGSVTGHRSPGAGRPATRASDEPADRAVARAGAGRSAAASTAAGARRPTEPATRGAGGARSASPPAGVATAPARRDTNGRFITEEGHEPAVRAFAGAPIPAAVPVAPTVLPGGGSTPARSVPRPTTAVIPEPTPPDVARTQPVRLVSDALGPPLTTSIPALAVPAAVPALDTSPARSTDGALTTALSVDPLSVGPLSVGPVSVSPLSVSPLSVGPVSVGPVSVGPVSVGPVSVGPEPVGSVGAAATSLPLAPLSAATPPTSSGDPPRAPSLAPVGATPAPPTTLGAPVTGSATPAPPGPPREVVVSPGHGPPGAYDGLTDHSTPVTPGLPEPLAMPAGAGSAATTGADGSWAPVGLSPETSAVLLAAAGLALAAVRRRATWWSPEIVVGPG